MEKTIRVLAIGALSLAATAVYGADDTRQAASPSPAGSKVSTSAAPEDSAAPKPSAALADGTDIAAINGDDVVKKTLANGLQIVVVPDHLAPVATTMLTYKVGSREADADFPGTAHALEHMMFRGTEDLSAAQIAAIGAALGGQVNAFTTNDATSYYFTMPSQFVDVALRLHAERMKGVLNAKADWQQERGAI